MIRKSLRTVILIIFLSPGVARALTVENFQVTTTQDLVDLCTVSASDPLAQQAIHFCHGYLVGAYQYHVAESAGPAGAKRLVCFPVSVVTRNEAVGMFVEWVKSRPQYLKEAPVETEFRFLVEKWPCNK